MRYILLIYTDEMADSQRGVLEKMVHFAAYDAFTDEVRQRGNFVNGEALQATAMATTVRLENGRIHTEDGAIHNTKEQLGGFYILNCDNLDEAIALAAKIPAAASGAVEIRPLLEMG